MAPRLSRSTADRPLLPSPGRLRAHDTPGRSPPWYGAQAAHASQGRRGGAPPRGITPVGYALKAGQLTYDCRYSTMHGMPVTGGRSFRSLKHWGITVSRLKWVPADHNHK